MAGKLNLKELQALDAKHHLHPFTDAGALNAVGTRIIERAEGVYLYDTEGKKFIDGMAGLWCVNLGYGRKELIEAATAQMTELPFYNSFFQCTTPVTVQLAAKIAEVAPAHMNHVFFTGSGSEANDTVIRMVRRYWQLKGQPERQVIISRNNGYHGSTMAGASLGGMKFMHEQGGLPIPGISHIRQPYWYGEGGDMDKNEFGLLCAQALEDRILALGPDKVAAFIAEPLQGAGGVIIPPDSYWPAIKKIVKKYDILLVVDEVICGFGRTGHWFGSDYFDLEPDLMPVAKGLSSGYLPIGGVIISDRVADVIINQCGEFAHGFTYSGHPVCAAVALETIRILQDEKIVENVRDNLAPYLNEQWLTLQDHPLVGEARSLGMVGALELVKDKKTRERFSTTGATGALCRDFCVKNGIVMRAVGETMIISPPLVITRDEIDELVAKARKSLDGTAEALGIAV
jgi:putrescine aminotransferase